MIYSMAFHNSSRNTESSSPDFIGRGNRNVFDVDDPAAGRKMVLEVDVGYQADAMANIIISVPPMN